LAAALVGTGWFASAHWDTRVEVQGFSARVNALVMAGAMALAGILVPVVKWLRPREAMRGRAAELVVALVGWTGS
jgi:predicted phage tail protein